MKLSPFVSTGASIYILYSCFQPWSKKLVFVTFSVYDLVSGKLTKMAIHDPELLWGFIVIPAIMILANIVELAFRRDLRRLYVIAGAGLIALTIYFKAVVDVMSPGSIGILVGASALFIVGMFRGN